VENWLESSGAFGVVLLLYLWKNTGYSVILLLAGLMTIPEEQYAAAEMDGANGVQKFFHITAPQMWYSVFFSLLFSLINAFKCFREILLIGGKHPNIKIYMLQHFINNNFENLNYARLSVASVLMFAAITVLVGAFYGFVRRKESYKE
jgi:multiple sugar transport system permease protein